MFKCYFTLAVVLLLTTWSVQVVNSEACKNGEIRFEADIQFLLDSSGSITISDFEKLKDYVYKFVQTFQIGHNDVLVGITTFSTQVKPIFYLHTYEEQSSLLDAIKTIPKVSGTTNTGGALNWTINYAFSTSHGGRYDVEDILIVITDGRSNNPPLTTKMSEKLHHRNVTVNAVGIGSGVNREELDAIATNSAHVYMIQSFDLLNTLKLELNKTTCRQQEGTCFYNGTTYEQGSIWHDGCRYTCKCNGGIQGQYTCTQRCPTTGTPPKCGTISGIKDSCCAITGCHSTCIDRIPNCKSHGTKVCQNSPGWSKINCMETCGLCDHTTQIPTTQPTPSTTPSIVTGFSGDCIDADFINCSDSNVCRDCTLKQYCPVTCGLCGSSTTVTTPSHEHCVDKPFIKCNDARVCTSSDLRNFCPKTCGICNDYEALVPVFIGK